MTIEQQRARLKSRGICVIIPTYNNAGTIVDITKRALEQCEDVIVVCDGCTDSSADIVRSSCPGADILSYEKNRGKGHALCAGFRHALERGFSYAITLDGDGQHYPEDIHILLEANLENPGALIVGERKNLDGMERSKGSKFANAFSNFWFAVQTAQRLKDTQTGYRLYPLKKLSGLSLITSRYEAELELMVFASWAGVRLVSTPVNVYYPPADQRVSHFRPAKDFTRISILNTILCILALVYGYPRILLRKADTFLRTAYSVLIFFITTVVIMTPMTHIYMRLLSEEKGKEKVHKLLHRFARLILIRLGIPGVQYTEVNETGEDFSKPAVVICNHQSVFDLLPFLCQTPKMIVISTEWAWKSPFFGHVIRTAEFFPASGGVDGVMPRLKELASKGYCIGIFPEGTRATKMSRTLRFHQGAFYLADTLGIDILPLFIYGSGYALRKHEKKLNRGQMYVEFGERISPKQMKELGETYIQRASAMRRRYDEWYRKTSDLKEQNA